MEEMKEQNDLSITFIKSALLVAYIYVHMQYTQYTQYTFFFPSKQTGSCSASLSVTANILLPHGCRKHGSWPGVEHTTTVANWAKGQQSEPTD